MLGRRPVFFGRSGQFRRRQQFGFADTVNHSERIASRKQPVESAECTFNGGRFVTLLIQVGRRRRHDLQHFFPTFVPAHPRFVKCLHQSHGVGIVIPVSRRIDTVRPPHLCQRFSQMPAQEQRQLFGSDPFFIQPCRESWGKMAIGDMAPPEILYGFEHHFPVVRFSPDRKGGSGRKRRCRQCLLAKTVNRENRRLIE